MDDSIPPSPAPKYGTFTSRMMASSLDISFIFFLVLPLVDGLILRLFSPIEMQHFIDVVSKMQLSFDNEHIFDSLFRVASSKAFWNVVMQEHIFDRMLVSNLLQLVFIAIYVLPFWFRYSATPGKMLFRLQIRDEKTGALMRRGQAVLRFAGYILSAAPFSLGFLWVLSNKKRRGWHDYLAGTVVIVKPRRSQLSSSI